MDKHSETPRAVRMLTSNTPRTDAEAGDHAVFHGVQFVSADFARRLERELSAALDRIKVLEGALEKSAKRLDVIAEEIHESGSCHRRSVEVYAFAIEARAALSGKETK